MCRHLAERPFVLSRADSAGTEIGPGRHTFAVKVVNDRGDEDPTPAAISFTARNTLPETEIISAPASITCPIVRFEWRGWDYDGIVIGYGRKLFWWDIDEWLEVAAAESVGADVVSAVFGPFTGRHRFDVWSIDDAGDVGEHAGPYGDEPPDVATLARALTVIWYYDAENTGLERAFDPYGTRYHPLAGYARVGGNLIMAGYRGLSHILHEECPIVISAGDSTEAEVFVRDVLGIASAENSGTSANKNSPWTYGYCFYGAVANPLASGIQLEAMYIDSLGTWSPLYGHVSPNYWHGGLPMVEAMEAWPRGGTGP